MKEERRGDLTFLKAWKSESKAQKLSKLKMSDPVKSFTSFTNHCESKRKKLGHFLEDNATLTEKDVEIAEGYIKKLEDQLERMEEKWLEQSGSISDDKIHETIDGLVTSTTEKCNDMLRYARNEVKKREVKSVQTVNPPTPKDTKPWKPVDSFKPNVLELTDQPSTLETWIRGLRAWIPEADKHSKSEEGVYQVNSLLEQVMSESTRSAVKFDPTKRTPIHEGENNLLKNLRDTWNRNHPLAKLRVGLFEFQSQQDESWDSWVGRLMEQVNQAKAREIDGETLVTILAVMNYKGPHSQKIRSELAKMSHKNDGKITLEDATTIAHAEEDGTSWERSTPSHLNKIQTQRGQPQNQNQNGGRNNQNSQKGNFNSQSSGISNHPHYNWMERKGHCRACFKTNCKNRACKNSNLECSFCKNSNQKTFKGHVKEACTKHQDFMKNEKKSKNTLALVQDSQETEN